MDKLNLETLLENPNVVDEINRHLWIESEKAGYDIGFEQAAKDWLNNYAKDWMSHHMPKAKKSRVPRKSIFKKKNTATRKRSAKTYL